MSHHLKALTLGIVLIGLPLIATAQTPVSITFSPEARTRCTQEPIGTVNISGPAPAGGLVIQLSSSVPSMINVPASVTVAEGQTSVRLPWKCTTASQVTAVTITATAGGVSQPAVLNVLSPELQALTLRKGVNLEGTVTITGPAPPNGSTVTLASSPSDLATVPQSITVPSGAATATFPITNIAPVSQPTTLTIDASGLGTPRSATHTVMPATPASLMFVNPNGTLTASMTVEGDHNQSMRVALTGPAGPTGLPVQFTSNPAGIVTGPTSESVGRGETEKDFQVRTVPVTQTTAVACTVTIGGASKSATLTVTPGATGNTSLQSLSLRGPRIRGGFPTEGTVTLSPNDAPAGGVSVQLRSSHAPATVPSSVTIPAGRRDATFTINTTQLNQPELLVTITATAASVTKTANLTVLPEAPSAVEMVVFSVVGGSSASGRITAPPGHHGFVAPLASSDPGAASVPASISFADGETLKTFPISTRPQLATTGVTISTTGPYNVVRSDRLQVRSPKITTLTIDPTTILAGRDASGRVELDGRAPAGLYIRFRTDTPGYAKIEGSETKPVPEGANFLTFSVHTFRPSSAPANVTISAVPTDSSGREENGRTYTTLTVRP